MDGNSLNISDCLICQRAMIVEKTKGRLAGATNWRVAVAFAGAWIAVLSPLSLRSAGASAAFTVRDAIQMSTFVDPYPSKQIWPPNVEFKFSLDHRYVAIVTERGLVAT